MNIRNKDNEEIKRKIQELQKSGVDLSVLTQDTNSFNQNEKSARRHM